MTPGIATLWSAIMSSPKEIEAGARAAYASDPRVNLRPWADADVQMQALYKLIASTVLAAAEKARKEKRS
jgi:hypothetical protein